MGAFSSIASGLDGLFSGDHSTDGGVMANLGQTLQGVGQLGQGIATAGGAKPTTPTSVVPSTPTSTTPAKTMTAPTPIGGVPPAVNQAMQGNLNPANAQPVLSSPVSTQQIAPQPINPGSSTVPTTTGTAPVIGSAGFTSLYGNDTGNAVTNLLNSETPGTANSTAQAIINANAPNVAQGSATLNTGLAASGISPSSSVSAIENANYQGQVQQQNLSEIAQTNMTEQQMQQSLLENLLPGQQQRETDSSGWNIFGNVMSGLGDVGGLVGL